MSVLETSPTFVVRKRNFRSCSTPRVRHRDTSPGGNCLAMHEPASPITMELSHHSSTRLYESQTLLHTTTGNWLKLLATDNVRKQQNSRKNGYWRARAVADVEGSPNARSGRRRHTLMDQSTCASLHPQGPPGYEPKTIPAHTRNLE